jgi:hypothetical protein
VARSPSEEIGKIITGDAGRRRPPNLACPHELELVIESLHLPGDTTESPDYVFPQLVRREVPPVVIEVQVSRPDQSAA